MLDRVRNPLWRAHKLHALLGGLEVYKPGSTAHRLAGWVERVPRGEGKAVEMVYVAEVYTDHEEYERDLPGRRRSHYNPREFAPYNPAAPDLGAEEKTGDELIAYAIQDKARAEADRDEALSLAARMEQERNESRREAEGCQREAEKYRETADMVRTQLATLETCQSEMDSWSLWRRLRWAPFGS